MKSIISKLAYFLLLLIIIEALLSSCNELPTEITYSLLYDTTTVLPISSDSVNFFVQGKTKYVFAKIFNVGAIFVGGWNGFRSASLLRFKESNLPDTLLWLTEDRIDSVRLVLPFQNYVFGDSLNSILSFKVFLINQYWTNQVTWDSVFDNWTPKPLINPTPIGSFSGKVNLNDSIAELSISLQKSFILDWLKKNKDSIPIWGILIAPDQSCNVIHRISAQFVTEEKVSHPKIVVHYKYLDSTDRVWYIHSAIDASVVDVPKVDTLNFLTIQSGFSYRVAIEFDLSKIPKFSAIHYAQLEMFIDPENTIYGNSGLDTIFTGGYFGTNPLDSVPMISFLGRREGTKVTFYKVSSPLELWLKENGKGEIVLYSYYWNESRTLNRISFYGLNATDPRKRPRLKIIYSSRKTI
ncbi:hypothetical protein D9V84_01125 [Bacteroidetes/Chlorobi group bacterium Naka2016]|jgi:hypothetical protein|nr:MAG: hypothetical protein D9V84_01125 [Bacteroidetes/Chlorobi group bacterium Naka2016]